MRFHFNTLFALSAILTLAACSEEAHDSSRTKGGAEPQSKDAAPKSTTTTTNKSSSVASAPADDDAYALLQQQSIAADFVLMSIFEDDGGALKLMDEPSSATSVPSAKPPKGLGADMIAKIIGKDFLEIVAAKFLKKTDKDASGSLSLEEFLAVRFSSRVLPAPAKAKIEVRRTELFNKFAGDDKLLSAKEIVTLLEEGRKDAMERFQKHQAECMARMATIKGEIFAQFDKDKDGKLDKDEFKALMDDRDAQIEKHRKEFRSFMERDDKPAIEPVKP